MGASPQAGVNRPSMERLTGAVPARSSGSRLADRASIRAVLFDLDNTLLLEDESTERALHDACAAVAGRTGADAKVMAVAAREAAEDDLRGSSVFAYADAMGIWWGEALWGEFTGDTPGLRALRGF